MDENLTCAEVCEARGFPHQAELFRAVAGGRLRAYAVVERARVDDEFLEDSGGAPVAIHLEREAAERDAARRNLRAFRERNLLTYCGGYIEDTTELNLPTLERQIGEILGRSYRLPEDGQHEGPFFAADATDEQMRAIMALFTIRFFDVAEVALGA